ncbi:MAG TPA: maleylpyruvate isomerase family mycothiol-dependent enzyme [Mycobacteriales bacterium]|nr:maleylpyruvate isomerase family mycothiol-dependent enzyme [Mycobacteriales bacterium]HWA66472.1 maleylpyruvate isomerase family mycothiol-dependent enzyme [Mycobacteriales bacterium]
MAQAYQRFITTDGLELWDRIDHAQARLTELARAVGPQAVVAGSSWTARDLVGHILTVARRYTERDIRSTDGLGDTVREVDVLNDRELHELGSLDMTELLAQLDAQMDKVRGEFPAHEVDLRERFPFHGGTTIDAAGGLSNLVGEFLIHGRDLARGLGRPWTIDSRDALLIMNGALQVTPGYAEPTATGTLRVLVRTAGAVDWMLAFAGGRLDSRPATRDEPVDVVLTGPAETLLLMFYSRIGTVESLRGGLRVGGPRPWRVARLSKHLQKP